MHISYALHSLDCNLADGEYVLIPEQGPVQEEDRSRLQRLLLRISPQPQQLKASPGFKHNLLIILFYYT